MVALLVLSSPMVGRAQNKPKKSDPIPSVDPKALKDALELGDGSKSAPTPPAKASSPAKADAPKRTGAAKTSPKETLEAKKPILMIPSAARLSTAAGATVPPRVVATVPVKLSPNAVGSMAPDVYLQDITHTLRMNYFRTMTVSRHDPNTVYVASWEGYVFKSIDGGRTWDESRLIVDRKRFFSDYGQFLYFGVHRLFGGMGMHQFSSRTVPRRANTGRGRIPRPVVGWDRVTVAGVARAGSEGNVNFGIGLPGRAPRLQNVVRKFGKPTAGLNIKQTLLERGYLPTEVRIVVEHPKNPKILFACTFYGLFMTWDGGLNWVRTFQGINVWGRIAAHVAVDPEDDQRVLLATGNGVYVSEDGGNNFIKTTQKGVGEGFINWLYYNPYDSRYVFCGTDYGLLRSKDRGRNWEWIYFTTFPLARVVRYIEIDPHDKRTGYIATHDGLFVTSNILTGSLEDWRRLGGLRFTNMEMSKITVNPKRVGHMWALSNMKVATPMHKTWQDTGGAFVWESVDNGRNWRVLYAGNTGGSMAWYENDTVDPSLLWLCWSRSLSRMRRRKPGEKHYEPSPGARQQADAIIAAERMPTVGEVMQAMWRYTGTDPRLLLTYRKRSRLKALVPRLDLVVTQFNVDDKMLLKDGLYFLPYRRNHLVGFDFFEWRAMLTWDLAPLVFNIKSILFGRVDRHNADVRNIMSYAVHRLYSEYRRLMLELLVNPPADVRTRLFYKLRVEELYSYIDFVTGGYLTRYKRGDRPVGLDTPWFERWDGTGPDISLGGKK